jgi:hypothetical protein
MPNATVRANARTAPKPAPAEPPFGSVESIRQQPAELTRDVALLNVLTAKRDAELDDSKHDLFARAYVRWLRARATLDDPDADGSDEAGEAHFKAVEETARSLLTTPAICDDELWQKWEVLEHLISDDVIVGQAIDNRTVMALGCVKADLMRLGVGRVAQ